MVIVNFVSVRTARVGLAVAAGLLSRLCACCPCGGFCVRTCYVHFSHALSGDLGLYFSLISYSFSFVVVWLFCLASCFLTHSALCSAVGTTFRTASISLSFMYVLCDVWWVSIFAPFGFGYANFGVSCFFCCHFIHHGRSFCPES